jgi:hypothetical protein
VVHKQHNPADDFDLMLRQHLKQGGAPVAPCAGFDADTANAYVERVLSAPSQLQFEKHLAGCAACRRHVVALARLSDALAPAPLATPGAPTQVAEPFWVHWQNALAQQFDFSGWNLGWTAATGTACAVLLAALGTGVWWRAQQAPQASLTANVAADTQAAPASLASQFRSTVELPDSPTGEPAKSASVESAQAKLFSSDTIGLNAVPLTSPTPGVGLMARPAIPPPATTPNYLSTNGYIALTNTPEMRMLAAEPSAPVITAPPTPPTFNLPATATSLNHLGGNQPGGVIAPVRMVGDAPLRSSSQIVLMPGEPEQKELVNELLLPGPRRNRAREDASDFAAASKNSGNRELLKALKGRTFGFMPMKDADKEAKDAKDIDARTKEADLKEAQEQTKPLMKRLNGHVFYFDHGFWIDDEYKSESKQPLKRLTRGSQEYQQILIQNPSLEQFFQLGQVIVVWKGVVYEVRK